MHLCYIDESGTCDIPGNTSHFVLAGISIPVDRWRFCDGEIQKLKKKYDLEDSELHTAWMLRKYLEQKRIPDFELMSYAQRRYEVNKKRNTELLRLQRSNNNKRLSQTRKNFKKTEKYIHLTHSERVRFIDEVAACVSEWSFGRLFAECIDKIYFDPVRSKHSVDEQAFEQVVSRFEQYLRITGSDTGIPNYGLLIHDNNETVSKKHTDLMKRYLQDGTLWTDIHNIIETPLFVDSQLTSMVQIADLCSYALRRYLENGETKLFEYVFKRADRKDGVVVGVRHFTGSQCGCRMCLAHRIE